MIVLVVSSLDEALGYQPGGFAGDGAFVQIERLRHIRLGASAMVSDKMQVFVILCAQSGRFEFRVTKRFASRAILVMARRSTSICLSFDSCICN
jgi:hypothetical protein